MKFYWDESVERYRDELGRFVGKDRVLQWVNQSLLQSRNAADTLASHVFNGTISVNDFELAMRLEIKDEYIRQYLSMMGGRDFMTQSDWGKVGNMVKEQYQYLGGFANDIATGEMTQAQIEARANMYINSAIEAREKAREKAAIAANFDEVYWGLNPQLENCDDCISFNAMGWQLVEEDPYNGAYPGSGDTVCLTNCGCELSYRQGESGEEYGY